MLQVTHALLMSLAVGADPKIALLGAMQSLFEASLYTFVFLWTPALAPRGERLPHGMIFACFMMACMAGSAIAGRLLCEPKRHPVSHYMKVGGMALPLPTPCSAVPQAQHVQQSSDRACETCQTASQRGVAWCTPARAGRLGRVSAG